MKMIIHKIGHRGKLCKKVICKCQISLSGVTDIRVRGYKYHSQGLQMIDSGVTNKWSSWFEPNVEKCCLFEPKT